MKDALSELHPSRNLARRMYELESELQRARMHLRRNSKSPETTGRWGLEQAPAPQQEEGWFLTYLDMMTLLLVVMIVMLAFSGSLGERPGQTLQKAEDAAPIVVDDSGPRTTEESPPIAQPKMAGPDGTSLLPADPDGTGLLPPDPDGTGLLPGGPGLLPGHAATPDTVAAAETMAPFPAMHTGPLPRDADIFPQITVGELGTPLLSQLYPGWTAADLVASFIGPPRPGSLLTAAGAEEQVQTASIAQATADLPGAQDEDPPSEGETLAAGLALGELSSDVEVVVNDRSVSFRVNSEILFDSSQADLSLSGLTVLRRIVNVLSEAGHEVTVEGHTDSVPVRRNVRYPSNWELSSARAGGVVRYLQANGISRGRLKAVGYADTRPIADNHTPEGRARNRRVELMIEQRDPE